MCYCGATIKLYTSNKVCLRKLSESYSLNVCHVVEYFVFIQAWK